MVNAIHAVVEELGGHTTFGRPLRTEGDLRVAIREGFPQTVVEETMRRSHLAAIGQDSKPFPAQLAAAA